MSNVAYSPEAVLPEDEMYDADAGASSDPTLTPPPFTAEDLPAAAPAPEMAQETAVAAAPLASQVAAPAAQAASADLPALATAPGAVADSSLVDASPDRARPIPRISIQAFCQDQRTAETLQSATGDRRLAKAHVSVHLGGTPAALAQFQDAPTPNLIIVESMANRDGMLAELDQLASVCDAGTKVIVIGHVNDVILYRELLRRGVSEYIVAPITELKIMESISSLYNDPDAEPVGHVFAFVGAKGGVGSSTICHNVAWALSRELKNDVVIADLDLPFGTAGLDFDKDPVQGIADALSSPDRLDEVLLDRLLAKLTDHLSLFAAPGTLDRDYEIAPEAYEWVIDVVRQNVPYVAVDMPHVWSSWARQLLTQADEIVITVAPDLANLRNAKNLVDLLRERRSNDNPPHLVVNQAGMPKRPEIPAAKFADALGLDPACVIDFDGESFGMASNNGQMIGEFAENATATAQLRNLAMRLVKRPETVAEPTSAFKPLLEKLKLRK
ncbi:MAG: AAA family ATPase [Pseudomonadota bacterium]